MAPLFADEAVRDYDIIAIQEPWRNKFQPTTYHPLKDRFDLVYNPTPDTRVCFFVNTQLRGRWSHTHHTPDLDTLHLQVQSGDTTSTLHIHNVYNPNQDSRERRGSALPDLRTALDANQHDQHLVLGDFNLHHPLWAGSQVRRTSEEAVDLLEIITDYYLEPLLPAGTKTRQERGEPSTIDLVFGSQILSERVISCGLSGNELDHDSDHVPITTILNITAATRSERTKRLWHQMKEDDFTQEVERNLRCDTELHRPEDIDEQVNHIVQTIQTAIRNHCPESRACPRSIPGWTPEIKEAQMQARRLRRRYQRLRTDEAWEEYRAARNHKGRLIKKLLRRNHRERVQEATRSPQGLWNLAKWAKNREQRQSFTPPLRDGQGTLRTESGDKIRLLKDSFFPRTKDADLPDLQEYAYPTPVEWPPFTQQEVQTTIRTVATRKAPGPDGIPNLVLKILGEVLTPTLTPLFNACIDLGYCPQHFRVAETVALRKTGKEDYTQVKSYRPVALLNTLGKVLEKVVARRLSELVERYALLPTNHFGGRKGISTDHALHWLLEKINLQHKGQAEKIIVSILSLDVSGAFDNVSHRRLAHNLRKRRIDFRVVRWVTSFLRGRQTTIRLPEATSELMEVESGIPQGSPMSLMLYLFFNADLIEACCCPSDHTEAMGWVDDVNILTWSASAEENCKNLEAVYGKCREWETKHASRFNPAKFNLIHLADKTMRNANLSASVHLDGREVSPVAKCRVLGLILDSRLNWNSHMDHIEAKTTKSLAALNSLGGSTWGTSYRGLRQIYQATILPQITYAASVWFAPVTAGDGYRTKAIRKLEAIQKKAARIITGAFRNVSGPALDIEAHLLPLRLYLEKVTAETYLRIRTTPLHDTLEQIRDEGLWTGYRNYWKDLPSRWEPLERHKHRCEGLLGTETLHQLEGRQPYLTPIWWAPPETHIPEDAEAARRAHDHILQRSPGIVFYTDGSTINDKVGTAAVQHEPRQIKQMFLGRKSEATVFTAELMGIQMALQLAQQDDSTDVVIFSDSQAAIKAITGPHRTGQQILQMIITEWDRLRNRGVHVAIHWIPAHQGIEGNELADQAAKEATGWRQMTDAHGRTTETDTDLAAPCLADLKRSLSALKRKLRQQVQEQWERQWQADTRNRALFRIVDTPTKKTVELHANLDKPLSAVIIQMRTGHIGLRHFLYSRRVPDIDSGQCQCGRGEQTVAHILFACPMFREERQAWRREERWSCDLKAILTDGKRAARAAAFMLATKLLGQFRSTNTEH